MRRTALGGLGATLALALATAAPAGAARPLTTGLGDPVFADAAESGPWLDRAVSERAGMIRINVLWREVAPARPATPGDPADPAYRWAAVDSAVKAATERRLSVLLTIMSAPDWAEGPHRDPGAPAGTWRPSVKALEGFGTAAARRYSGTFADPQLPGASLPQVRYWQAWNEPNLGVYLSPQWTRGPGSYRLESPARYRAMLNGIYAGIKRAQPRAMVVSAGLAPYGDLLAGGERVPPVRFVRELLCLRGSVLRRRPCPRPAHLDAIAQNTYAVGGPLAHAVNADDVSVPDVWRVTRVVRAAQRSGRVLPRGRKRVWITEISWDSSPPDPDGVPIATQAAWLEKAHYLFWRQGVDTVLWLQIVDRPPRPSFATTYQGGLFFLDGTAKPAAQAFRFPFVVVRSRGGRLTAWGKAPAAGPLAVQRRIGSTWRTIRHLSAGRNRVFVVTLRLRGDARLRAVSGVEASRPWPVRVD